MIIVAWKNLYFFSIFAQIASIIKRFEYCFFSIEKGKFIYLFCNEATRIIHFIFNGKLNGKLLPY